jgi:hypothetical protein
MSLPFEGRCSIQLSYGRAASFSNLITELECLGFRFSEIGFSGLFPILCPHNRDIAANIASSDG